MRTLPNALLKAYLPEPVRDGNGLLELTSNYNYFISLYLTTIPLITHSRNSCVIFKLPFMESYSL